MSEAPHAPSYGGSLSPDRRASSGSAGAPLDMTSPAHRYKLRACLTCLAQVRALLIDVQAQPEPLAVPDDYVPLRSLADGDEDILTTPRPLRRDRLTAATGGTSHFSPNSGDYSGDDDELAALAELEDGRQTAMRAVAARATHDPRLATVQGLLQHIDQLTLEGDDAQHLITSYPSWLAPQMSQVLGMINSLFPTAARRAADRVAANRARSFRDALGVRDEHLVSTGQFESFLDRHLQEARKRQERLEQLSELQSSARDAEPSAAAPNAAHDAGAAATNENEDADEDEDPFASLDGAEESSQKGATKAEQHDERKRPHSAKGDGQKLQQRSSTHRTPRATPLANAGHSHRRAGAQVEVTGLRAAKHSKYDAAPRSERVPSLYEPRKRPSDTTVHPPKKVVVSTKSSAKKKDKKPRQQRQRQQHGEPDDHDGQDGGGSVAAAAATAEEDDDDPFAVHDSDATPPLSRTRSHAPSAQASSAQLSVRSEAQEEKEQVAERDNHTHRPAPLTLADMDGEEEAEASDDDPFAVHDSPPPTPPTRSAKRLQQQQYRPSASPALARRSGAPPMPQSPMAAMPAARPSPSPSRSASAKGASSLSRTATRSRPMSPAVSSKRVDDLPATQKRSTTAAAAKRRSQGMADNPFSSRAALHPPAAAPAAAPTPPSPPPAPVHPSSSGATLQSRRGLFDDAPGSWQDVELKLLAMNEELREQRDQSHRDVQQEVSEAMQKLSQSIRLGLDPLSHATSKASLSADDLTTLQWENALQHAFANGKRIIGHEQEQGQEEVQQQEEQPQEQSHDLAATVAFTGSSPSSTAHLVGPSSPLQHVSSAHDVHVNALLGATLATAQSDLQSSQSATARLEAEKAELQRSLAELQERDKAHAHSLFLLMDKLNSIGANGGRMAPAGNAAQQQRLRQAQRAQLASAAFVAPFGSPPGCAPLSPTEAATAAARRLYPLGSALAHDGGRSLRLPSPEEIAIETACVDPFVPGLDAPDPLPEPAYPQPTHEQLERQAQEARLVELEHELSSAQHVNQTLRAHLDEASMQSAVLARAAQEQKIFLTESMAAQGQNERVREMARIEVYDKQRQEDLRKIQQSEKQIAEIKEEQRVLRAKFDSERAALQADTQKLMAELAQKSADQLRMQAEANLLRARLEQLQQEQAAGQGSYGSGTAGWGSPHSRRAAPSQPRGALAPADGDGGSAPAPDDATALLGPDGHPLPTVPASFVGFLSSSFRGDYLKLRHSSSVAHVLASQARLAAAAGAQRDDVEDIVFSDYVIKYNRRNAGQARVLVLTPQALYLFAGSSVSSLELRRRIGLRSLVKISLSRLCTDLIVLHHQTEHDALLSSPKRPEVMYHLQQCWSNLHGGRSSLPYQLGERLYVKDRGAMVRDVQILDSQRFKLGKAFPMQGEGR